MASEGIEAEAEARRLLRMARADDTPAARQLRARARLEPAAVLFFALSAAVLVAWAWYVRSYGSPRDALGAIVSYSISLMFVAIVPFGVWSQLSNAARKLELALFELRRAAASGDERMPAVIDQPAGLDTADFDGERTFEPLRWLDRPYAIARQMAAILLLVMPSVALMIGSYHGWAWSGPLAFLRPVHGALPGIPWYAQYAVSAVVASVYLFVVVLVLFSGMSGMTVTADAQGIRWTTGRRRTRTMQIAWHEVHSFTRLEFRHKVSPKPHTTFVLDCGRAILSWGYDPIWHGDQFPVESRLLARLIVTHSGVPLRQATPFAAEVLREVGAVRARWWERRLQMPRGTPVPPPLPGLAAAFRLLSLPSVVRRALVLLACLPLILYVGYGIVSFVPR